MKFLITQGSLTQKPTLNKVTLYMSESFLLSQDIFPYIKTAEPFPLSQYILYVLQLDLALTLTEISND